MTHAIRIHETGGANVLKWQDLDAGDPQPGQVRLRQTAVGLNYIDIYHRTGVYPTALPGGLGVEAAGVVEAVGEGVALFKTGDRVAYAGGVAGAYAESRVVPATLLVKLPDNVSDEVAAGFLLQGMTVQFLIRACYKVKPGQTVLWHAAAGGVGLVACQWLKALGVNVIGTVSSEDKAAIARAHGCAHTIISTREDIAARVRELTGGAGVPVVYDSVGKDTWDTSLNSLQPLGTMVSFGNSSGVVPPFSVGQLAAKGSLFVTRPILAHYIARREDLESTARDLFDFLASGSVNVGIRQRYALKDAAQAHMDLEGRKTTGSSILVP